MQKLKTHITSSQHFSQPKHLTQRPSFLLCISGRTSAEVGGNHTLRERGQPQLAHAQEDAGHPQQHPRLAEARQLDGGDAVGAGPAREGV